MYLRKIGCKIYLVSSVIKIPRSSRGPELPIGMVTLVVVGCKTTLKGINQTSKIKIGSPIWEFKTAGEVFSSPPLEPMVLFMLGQKMGRSTYWTARVGTSYGNLNREVMCGPPPPSVLMARFTSGHLTKSSMPSRPRALA